MLPTLGYKEPETFRKSDVARMQLVEAICLFVREQFIPSLTLAGAAEELLAGLLRADGKQPTIEESFSSIKKIRDNVGLAAMANKTKSEVIAEWNHAKNRTKHQDKDEASSITLNDCDEAYWMIKRALDNANKLGITIPNVNDFENWVIINVCL